MNADVIEIETPHGTARAHRHRPGDPRALMVLGHGAGGGITAADLQAATQTGLSHGLGVVLVEQPYRVAGRRSPAPARQLDAAWLAVIAHLSQADERIAGLPLVVGGRSMGARVACRTAAAAGAAAVLCLAFPLHPPRRKPSAELTTRLPELEAVTVPVLVVQGERDPFGIPPAGPGRTVDLVAGDHSLRTDRVAVAAAISRWLEALLPLR